MSGVEYDERVLREIAARCETDPERESCGFVVRRGTAAPLEVVPVPNVADRYHALDPVGFPRTGRDSYLMDVRTLRRVQEELDATQGRIVAVWHSHVDAGAYFSVQDRADAVVDGEQLLPGVEYLVLSLRRGAVVEGRRFRYTDGQFVGVALGGWGRS